MIEHEDIYGFQKEYRWLSNFYILKEPIDIFGCKFYTTENLYQAFKCAKEDDFICMSNITPAQAKRLGKRVELNPEFESNKLSIMKNILSVKFNHQYFKNKLILTGKCYIEETNTWGDTFWGVCNGYGQNNLGKIIMEIRDELVLNSAK